MHRVLNWCRAYRAPLAVVSLGTAVVLGWRRSTEVLQEEEKEEVQEQHPDLLDLDWERPIEELAADEACPPCFKSELLGPCGKVFAPAYKCFRLSEIENKDPERCSPLFEQYMSCAARHPERYGEAYPELFKDKESSENSEDQHDTKGDAEGETDTPSHLPDAAVTDAPSRLSDAAVTSEN